MVRVRITVGLPEATGKHPYTYIYICIAKCISYKYVLSGIVTSRCYVLGCYIGGTFRPERPE